MRAGPAWQRRESELRWPSVRSLYDTSIVSKETYDSVKRDLSELRWPSVRGVHKLFFTTHSANPQRSL